MAKTYIIVKHGKGVTGLETRFTQFFVYLLPIFTFANVIRKISHAIVRSKKAKKF